LLRGGVCVCTKSGVCRWEVDTGSELPNGLKILYYWSCPHDSPLPQAIDSSVTNSGPAEKYF